MRVDIFIKEIGQVEEALLKNATRKEVTKFYAYIYWNKDYYKKERLQNAAEANFDKFVDKKTEQILSNEKNRIAANQFKQELENMIKLGDTQTG